MKSIIKKQIAKGSILMMALLSIVSCIDENYLEFDDSFSGVYFPNDTLRYSFGVTPIEVRTKEYRIPVELLGAVKGYDRNISYRINAGTTTAEQGEQYVINAAKVEADSIRGYIPVVISRDELDGDYEKGYTRYILHLSLVGNEHLKPTLSPQEQQCVLIFDNAVEQPDWFDYKGDKVWSEGDFGVWHPLKLIKMVEFFHAVEDVQPESYKKMVAAYGENLENVPYGDFYLFITIMTKYVFNPLYEYFSDPDNKEEILGEYPDFPFDFPDPYAEKDGFH